MKELNSFSKQVPYVAPTCKMVVLHLPESLLVESTELQYGSIQGSAGGDLENNDYDSAF